ncbi:MAG: hypothetical protein PHE50_05695 [Dehalococcoidales bacterium]|nr:hypothetical protein [Dehalococcoidales bacterium]
MKRPDTLVLIAIWQFLAAFASLIGIAGLAAWGFAGAMNGWGSRDGAWSGYYHSQPPVWEVFFLTIGITALVCLLTLAVAGGVGLIKGKEWGRITSLVFNALGLFIFPVGTIIGTLALVYLTKKETKDFFSPPIPAQ